MIDMKVSELNVGIMLTPVEGYSAVILQDVYSLSSECPTNELQLYRTQYVDVIVGLANRVQRRIVSGPIMYLGKRKIDLGKKTYKKLKRRAGGTGMTMTIHELLCDGEVALMVGREFRNLQPIQFEDSCI